MEAKATNLGLEVEAMDVKTEAEATNLGLEAEASFEA
jgi:hypothetical protein